MINFKEHLLAPELLMCSTILQITMKLFQLSLWRYSHNEMDLSTFQV